MFDEREGYFGANEPSAGKHMPGFGRKVSSFTAIIPVPVGTDHETMTVSEKLYEKGLFIHGIRPQTVPEGEGQLRVSLMATHTAEMVETAV